MNPSAIRCSNAFGRSSIIRTSTTRWIFWRGTSRAYRRDDAEQPVAADRQAEQLGILRAAAGARVPARIDQHERLHVGDERLHLQAAAVDVRRQRAADRQPIGAGLLLRDAPLPRAGPSTPLRAGRLSCCLQQVIDERGPHDARLDIDDAPAAIERAHAIEPRHVEHHRVFGELLGAHRVAAAGDADPCPAVAARRNARWRSEADEIDAISRTRVGFSCEWMSLTIVPVSRGAGLQRKQARRFQESLRLSAISPPASRRRAPPLYSSHTPPI